MALSAGTRLGSYEIVGAMGAGGIGEVCRARDRRLNRDVAIKVLSDLFAADPDRMARFEREARLLAALNHPHIAAIYGLEESVGVRAIAIELVDGPSLADRLHGGPIPLADALPLVRQLADALDAGHEKGIIRCHSKLANVKVTPDGHVKVLDFGLAGALEGGLPGADPANSPTITAPAMTRAGV